MPVHKQQVGDAPDPHTPDLGETQRRRPLVEFVPQRAQLRAEVDPALPDNLGVRGCLRGVHRTGAHGLIGVHAQFEVAELRPGPFDLADGPVQCRPIGDRKLFL